MTGGIVSTLVSLDQITQLRELERARGKREGVGYGPEFQAFLDRLKSGGVSPAAVQSHGKRRKGSAKLPTRDPRIIHQAKVLWDKGWTTGMKDDDGNPRYPTFADYLASIPDLPAFPAGYDERFPHLVLVDRRVKVVEACQMLNVKFEGNNRTLVAFDPAKASTQPVYWMRCQDGKAYRHRKPSDCRMEFSSHGDEIGLDALEGLACYVQEPSSLELNTAMDLPGSVHSGLRDNCAYLRRWADDGVRLGWCWGGVADPSCGSASRGECVA